MGDYTGLRAKVIIKPEFEQVIETVMRPFGDVPWQEQTQEQRQASEWELAAERFPQYPFLAGWATVGRCDFIPRGALCIPGWQDDDPEWERSFENRRWVFQCSLKNYEREIETFCRGVLTHIVESVEVLYSQFEYDDDPTHIALEITDEIVGNYLPKPQ